MPESRYKLHVEFIITEVDEKGNENSYNRLNIRDTYSLITAKEFFDILNIVNEIRLFCKGKEYISYPERKK